MTAEDKLFQLAEATATIAKLPIMQLAENKPLVKQLKQIISSKNFSSLVDSIANDYMIEKRAAMNGKSENKSSRDEQGQLLLNHYVKFQNVAYNVLKEKASPRFTVLTTKPEVAAFNAIKEKPIDNEKIKSLPEAKEFAEVFNSIFSDRGLQIRTSDDPTQIQSFIDYSPYIWNYKDYLAIPILSQTIDRPINMATRTIPDIVFEDPKLTKKMNLFLKRSRIMERVKKLMKFSSLSPRGGLLVPINDNGQVRYNVFNDTQFTYAASQQYSNIDFHDNLTGVSQIFCLGNILQNEVTAHFLCPGFEPLYAIGKNRLVQLKEAAEAVNIYVFTIKLLCVRAQILIQTTAMDGQTDTKLAALQQVTRQIDSVLSASTSVNLPHDTKLDILTNNFSPGFAEVQPILKDFMGILTGMKPDYLFGSSTAYQANNFNIATTHQDIRSERQEGEIEPALRFIINTQLTGDNDFIKWKYEVDKFDIIQKSMYEETEEERLNNASKKIDNLIKMREYPELKDAFIKEDLWKDDIPFPSEPPTEIPET